MIEVRPISDSDSFEELTELLHRSYAPLLAMGLRFVATHQDVETTRQRVCRGFCFVAESDSRLVGTITVYRGDGGEEGLYGSPEVAHFGQLAVDPKLQGTGLGRRLVEHAEAKAREWGCKTIALDTSDEAHDLIRLYERWGYEVVGKTKWDEVNYESVLMARPL